MIEKYHGRLMKAARVMAGLSQSEAAEAAGTTLITMRRIESEREDAGPVSGELIAKVRAVYERAGIQFIAENGGGAGVRLARKTGDGAG